MPDGRANNFWYARRDVDDVIVFVHGIFSSSRTCWLHVNEHDPSRSVFWPDLLLGDSRFGQASIYLGGYYTAIDAGDFAIKECAGGLFAALERQDADGWPAVLASERLTFVCHSTGGIVVRYMLERNADAFKDKTIGLALIASPSLGSQWADIAGSAASYYNQHLGQQLQWRGEALEDLDARFKDLVASRPPRLPRLFGMEAAENKMVFRDRLPRLLQWLVPPRRTVVNTLSAGRYFGEVTILPGTDHFSSVKPTNLAHPAHEFLVTFRQRFLQAFAPSPAMPQPSPHVPPPAVPDLLDAEDWPAPATNTTTELFLGVEGFGADSEVGVATCVVVDGSAVDRSLAAVMEGWLRDPALREIPGLAATVKGKDVDGAAIDGDLAGRLVDWLAGELFEAYVCYTGSTTPEGQSRALGAILEDRIIANRTRPIRVVLDPSLQAATASIEALVERARQGAARLSRGQQVPSIDVETGRGQSGALGLVRLVSRIVRVRLRSTNEVDRRPFKRIHPQKIRVLHDLDADIRYSRRRPFGA